MSQTATDGYLGGGHSHPVCHEVIWDSLCTVSTGGYFEAIKYDKSVNYDQDLKPVKGLRTGDTFDLAGGVLAPRLRW